MAASDLVVRVSMADVNKFVRDGERVKGTTEDIGASGERAGVRGSRGLGLMSSALTVLRRTAYLAGASLTAISALVIKNGLSYNAAFQSAETSFTTLLGSSGRAKQLMDELRDVSNGTPLRFTEVLEASKRMLGMGVSADRTVTVLKGLNAAMLATGGGSEQFDRASLALGQIEAKGKASAEELMQLAEAGVPVNKILQRELGMTAEEVSKIGESGIDSGRVLDAIARGWTRQFGEAAKNARNDWNNQTAQLTKDREQFQRVITEPLFIRLNTDFMPRAMRTMRAATKGFQQGFESGGMLAGFDLMFRRMDIAMGANGRLIKGWRALERVGRDLGRIITDGIVPGIMILASVFSGLPTPLGSLVDLLGLMADNAELVTAAVVIGGGAWIAYTTAMVATTAALKIAATAQKLLNFVMNMNPLVRIITLALLFAAGLKMLYDRSETFRNAVNGLWVMIQATFNWVRGNWPLLLAILTGPIGAAVAIIVAKWDTITQAAAAVWHWFKDTWSLLGDAIAAPFAAAWEKIQPILSRIQSTAEQVGRVFGAISPVSGNRSVGVGQGAGAVGGNVVGAEASGGPITHTGLHLVGERGPELVRLPAGGYVENATITNHRASSGAAAAGDRPIVVQLQVGARQLAEVVVNELRAVQARR